MNQPASMKDAMPQTADWVNQKRAEWGRAHVDDCMRRAMQGQAGYFYAIEGGRVVGTPFAPGANVEGGVLPPAARKGIAIEDVQRAAVLYGATFAGFMRAPDEGAA